MTDTPSSAVPSRPTVIDTDPGIDDAVAIMLAARSPEFDLEGVVTVAGNIGLDKTTANARRVLSLCGRAGVPVLRGAAAPLERPAREASDIHGGDGLGGVAFPEPAGPEDGRDGIVWLAETLRAAPAGSIDVLALGPLTNIARLVRAAPDAAARMGRLIVMGGAIEEPGNVGPRAEFNMAADPEAAAVVFGAGLPVTLIPLDVTRRVRADGAWTGRLATGARPEAQASAALIRAYFDRTPGVHASRPLHDPCVMLLALRPDLFGVRRMGIRVDCGRGVDAGALTVDAGAPEIDVAMTVDGRCALKLLWERLAG